MSKRRYLTITYTHLECGWAITVRTAVPAGREHHALSYRQGIGPETCLRCRQRRHVENCIGSCCAASRSPERP